MTLEGREVKKIRPGKRPGSPPSLELGPVDPAFEASKKARVVPVPKVSFDPSTHVFPKGPVKLKYWILQHSANARLTYLVAMKPGETQGCFVYFFPYMFYLDKPSSQDEPDRMPCVKLSPAPASLDVTASKWWLGHTFPDQLSSSGVQCFPMPNTGFKAGDYISIKRSPGTYGWVSAVVYRTSGEQVYLVCAVSGQGLRLLMATRVEVEGPEFTFVPPAIPLWSKSVFPVLYEQNPERFGYFEAPALGFQAGDPVTVFKSGKTISSDGKIMLVQTTDEGLIKKYHVEHPGGKVVCYAEENVLGPRVDRFNADLDPAQLTPDPDLMRAVKEAEAEEDDGILWCEEEMQEEDSSSPPGMHHAPSDPSVMLVTPVRDLTRPNVVRGWNGRVGAAYPGFLINEAARRIRARDAAAGLGPA